MEGKRKRLWIVLLSILLSVGMLVIFVNIIFGMGRRSYELHLPAKEKLVGISVEKKGMQAEITDDREMEELLFILGGSGRRTKLESVSDAPVNAGEMLEVDFHFAEKGTSTLFVYKKSGGYYMEQPYNGIYKISGEEYNAVEKYVR